MPQLVFGSVHADANLNLVQIFVIVCLHVKLFFVWCKCTIKFNQNIPLLILSAFSFSYEGQLGFQLLQHLFKLVEHPHTLVHVAQHSLPLFPYPSALSYCPVNLLLFIFPLPILLISFSPFFILSLPLYTLPALCVSLTASS